MINARFYSTPILELKNGSKNYFNRKNSLGITIIDKSFHIGFLNSDTNM